ncbi:MAG: winged helix-turn-helix domain-containing protein [Candidatus Acidiferrales bacterium]
MRLLLSENDAGLRKLLQRNFEAEGYAVDFAGDARCAEILIREHSCGLAILDVSFPDPGGIQILRHVRTFHGQLPVILLASPNQLEDPSRLQDLDADDFILKPFGFPELSARVWALRKRGKSCPDAVLRVEDLELSRVERTVKRAGRTIDLTPREFALLEYLLRNAGQHVTRAQIIEHVWNLSFDTPTNVVDVYINYVRKKIDTYAERKLIHTVRGVGYQLQGEAPQSASESREWH